MPNPILKVIAHRGASSYAPENTFAAFDRAIQLEANHIELDTQFTSDDHIVIIHDDTVDRTTNGLGPVINHTLAELQEFDAGSWFGAEFSGEQIPTFDAVLARYKGRLHIHTEIKGNSASLSPRTADLIRKHKMQNQVTITSFALEQLAAMRAYAPELRTGWLVVEVNDSIVAKAQAKGFTQLCPRAISVTPALVSHLHAANLEVRAWGVGTDKLMQQVVKAGVDGMTVNFPDDLIRYLKNNNCLWE